MKTSHERLGVIINPAAGRNKGKRVWQSIENELIQRNIRFKGVISTYPGKTEELARQMEKEGYSTLAVIGGDGTVNEVINNIDLAKTRVGIIPAGTGNDFCRSVQIPSRPIKALQIILDGHHRLIDVGHVQGADFNRLFYNIAGIGFDAEIAREINEKFKWIGGAPAYILAVLKHLVTFKNFPVEIRFDDQRPVKNSCFLLAVGNAKYIGGGLKLIPGAEIDDGLFHVLIARNVGKMTVLANLNNLFSGTHLSHPNIVEQIAKEVEILPTTEVKKIPTLHCDGEILGHIPAKISILPQRLKFILPIS